MKTWAAWLLVISVQLHLDLPALVVYLDPEDPPADTALVERVACPSLRTDRIRRFQKAGEAQRYVPTPQVVRGLLTRCE
jgi:hypothetical protein